MNLHRQGKSGTFHIIRRVPKRFASLGLGTFFKKSLHTGDQRVAEKKAAQVWEFVLLEWEARLAGRDDEAVAYHAKLVEIAEALGHAYLPADELAEKPMTTILARIKTAKGASPEVIDAALGASKAPALPLSQLAEIYETLMAVENKDKSEGQLQRWRTGVERTTNAFIAAVGDVDVVDVDPSMAYRYKAALSKRITKGEISAYTGNREMYTLNAAIKRVAKNRFAVDMDPFQGLLFQEKKQKKRNRQVSFDTEWITGRILAEGALAGINEQCRDLWLIMINTPVRPAELAALQSRTIRLDHDVPHISIEPDGRQVKTVFAERTVPLVGRSLDIMRRYPNGFTRYYHRAPSWSANISKGLKRRGLLPTDQHKAYSLRHSLSDRLLNAGCPDRIKDQLMGHAEDGTPYGEGLWLETAQEWLQRVAV